MTRCVIVVGAGATLADFTGKSLKNAPPLDREFFSGIAKSELRKNRAFREVLNYLGEVYSLDLLDHQEHSLENILSTIYSDIYTGGSRGRASDVFRHLLRLLHVRIGQTTNNLNPGQKGKLYRIMCRFFEKGIKPEDITILTFNYDLRVEKTLRLLNNTEKWENLKPVLCFPWCYALSTESRVSNPRSGPRFEQTNMKGGVRILKLHGSLNWYSRHVSPYPKPKNFLDPKRNIYITSRREFATGMTTKERGGRTVHTFPVILPPIGSKSAIIHREFEPLWLLAQKSLEKADRVIFFGYSCPITDMDSSNMVGRALRKNKNLKCADVIDPSPETFGRYVNLTNLPRLAYYRNADAYLQHLGENRR